MGEWGQTALRDGQSGAQTAKSVKVAMAPVPAAAADGNY